MMGDLFGETEGSDEEQYWDDCEQSDLPDTTLPKLPEKPLPPRGASRFCGLQNQGNTCYMNSLLQTLHLTPEFRRGVYSLSPAELHLPTLECPEPEPNSQRHILIALQDLFARMQADDVEATDTQELTDSFGADFNVNQQEDLQELKVILMDSLASELEGTSARDLLPSLFQGVYQNQIVVDPCDALPNGFTRNLADEVFTDIFVQVSGTHTLEAALRAKVTFDELNGANQWACDEAGGVKVDASKGVSFKRLPQLLCFTLMRFEMNWMVEPPTRSKITDELVFPLELDMAPFTRGLRPDGSEIIAAPADAGAADIPMLAMLYDLSAVVVHEGGAYGGHYHVYVRDVANEGDGSLDAQKDDNTDTAQRKSDPLRDFSCPASQGKWFNFNDATVTRVSVSKLRSTFGGSSCAYMLVYRKREMVVSLGGVPSTPLPLVLPPHLSESTEIRRIALERKRADYEDALHAVNLVVHLPSSLNSDHETGLLRIGLEEPADDLNAAQIEMTEDEELAAALAISMEERAPPIQALPSINATTSSVQVTVDSRWSMQKVREEIADKFRSMDPSMFAHDAMLFEAVCSTDLWRMEPMHFAHGHAYFPAASSLENHLEMCKGVTAHVLAWIPPSKWPDPACTSPEATWIMRGESARPVQLSIAQLMDTSDTNEEEAQEEESSTSNARVSQSRIRPPSQVEKLEHGVLLIAPYLDVQTLLLKIQEKTGIETHNQLLLCVRQGYQKRAATGQKGVGARENLAECAGQITTLVESGVLSDEAELTVELKQAGWHAGGGILSLAERAKAARERIDLIHVVCDDVMLSGASFQTDVAMSKGSTIEELRQAAKVAIMSEVGCGCTRRSERDDTSCKLCNSQYRLRRCIVDYDYAIVDSTVFSAVDAELPLNDADLYTGSAVRVEVGLPPTTETLTFPVQFQEKISQSGDMIRWHALSRWDFKTTDTVGQVKQRLVEYANDLENHPWMAETEDGLASENLPAAERQALRSSFVWSTAEVQIRIGSAISTTAIAVEPGRTLKDESQTLIAAGLTENTALFVQRSTPRKEGELSLKLYRQASDMLPQPGFPVTGVLPLRANQSLPVSPEIVNDNMTLAELKTKVAGLLNECQSHDAVASQLASCVRLRHVSGSGDKRRPLHPTTIVKADAAARLSTLRELHKSDHCALAVALLPQPELLLPTDKVFTLWQLQPAQGDVGVPQFVAPQVELIVRPEPTGSSLTFQQLLAAIHRQSNIPTDQIRIAKRQVTNLAEWGPWQSIGEPILPPRTDVVPDAVDTLLPEGKCTSTTVMKRRPEKVHKLPDCTVLGIADASLFPLLQEGGSLEQLLSAAEGGSHSHRRTSGSGGCTENQGKTKTSRPREPDTLKIRRYGDKS